MIITTGKSPGDLVKALSTHRRIVLVGCGLCAATCETGGEKQVREMARFLTGEGKDVTAEFTVEGVCHKRRIELVSRKNAPLLKEADAVLVLACGAGTQTVAEVIDLPAYPALDTHFFGQIERHGTFREVCLMCGDCSLEGRVPVCPVARCPKSLLNGPCGGAEEGRCEVIRESMCAWIEIYEKLSSQGRTDDLKKIRPPRDHSRTVHPHTLTISKKEG